MKVVIVGAGLPGARSAGLLVVQDLMDVGDVRPQVGLEPVDDVQDRLLRV